MRTLKYGGELKIGDFIAVSNGNYLEFGWYCGDGRGTLQYYFYKAPIHRWRNYLDTKEKDEKQGKSIADFSIKNLWKSYINAVHKTRVMKITHPEEIFTEPEDIEYYELSREVLIKLKFINK